MEVVGHKCPGINNQFFLTADSSQPGEKILAVPLGSEYFGSLNAPPHDVMESTRRIHSWLSRHIFGYNPNNNRKQVVFVPTSPFPIIDADHLFLCFFRAEYIITGDYFLT
jgi:hypothetical protein